MAVPRPVSVATIVKIGSRPSSDMSAVSYPFNLIIIKNNHDGNHKLKCHNTKLYKLYKAVASEKPYTIRAKNAITVSS